MIVWVIYAAGWHFDDMPVYCAGNMKTYEQAAAWLEEMVAVGKLTGGSIRQLDADWADAE